MDLIKLYALACGVLIVLTGCKSTLKMEDFPNREIIWQPDNSLLVSGRKQVLIVPSKSNLDDVKSSKIAQILDGKVSELFVNTGVEIIDRQLQQTLLTEIRYCERVGRPVNRKCFKSKVPDIIISPQITGLRFKSSFSKAYQYKDKKGKNHSVPSSCTYSAEFDSVVNVYKSHELQLQESVNIKGADNVRKDSRNSNCPLTASLKNEIISLSVQDAAKYYASDIKSTLSPEGGVLEYRWSKKQSDNIFRLSIGKGEGAHVGLEVIISRPYSPQVSIDKRDKDVPDFSEEIARGTIVDTNSQYKEAWFYVKSRQNAVKIKKGDKVKIVYPEKACKDMIYKKWCDLF